MYDTVVKRVEVLEAKHCYENPYSPTRFVGPDSYEFYPFSIRLFFYELRHLYGGSPLLIIKRLKTPQAFWELAQRAASLVNQNPNTSFAELAQQCDVVLEDIAIAVTRHWKFVEPAYPLPVQLINRPA